MTIDPAWGDIREKFGRYTGDLGLRLGLGLGLGLGLDHRARLRERERPREIYGRYTGDIREIYGRYAGDVEPACASVSGGTGRVA